MRKKLLIFWSTRTYIEVVQPLISELCENFVIVVFLTEYSTPPGLIDLLGKLKKEGAVEDFIIAPFSGDIIKSHLFMKSKIHDLKKYDFDFWLSTGEVHVQERYISDCILSDQCVSVCMSNNITYLFMYHESMVRKLLPEFQLPGEGETNRESSLQRYLRRTMQGEFLVLAISALRQYVTRIHKKLRMVCDRFILPFFLVGRVFSPGPYDQITNFSSGRADALIFFDELEVEAHKRLLGTPNVYVAQYPSQGNCRCGLGSTNSTTILSPLSGFEQLNKISSEALSLFYRDFNIALLEANAKSIHLRVHPDERGEWPWYLRDYLVDRGMDVSVVGCERPIREIMCDYMGMAGFASAALRDARFSCEYAFVIGFEGVSKVFKNPKFVFANSEGISWIDKAGKYEDGIFVRKKYTSPGRQSVPGLLIELSKTKKKGV